MFQDCEGCKRRREAMIAAAKRMAEWIKHPVGAPPLDLSSKPQVPRSNRPALDSLPNKVDSNSKEG